MRRSFPVSPSGNLGDIIKRPAPGGGYLDQANNISTSAEQLEGLAGRLAAGLVSAGFERGDRIAMLGANGLAFTVAYLGMMRAGLVPVPINHRLPPVTINHIFSDCGARAVFADADRRSFVGAGHKILGLDRLHEFLAPNEIPPVEPEPGEIAEILYTSGSTGMPKGVPLSHDGQLWALQSFVDISPTTAERTIIAAPAYHMNGLFFTTMCLAAGYHVVSMPAFNPVTYLKTVAHEQCTLLSGIPTMFALMARESRLIEQLDLTSVRDVVIGSAPLTQALIDRVCSIFPNASVRNSYGTTETGPSMFGPHPDGLPRPPLALGYPFPDVEFRLLDGGSPDEGMLETRTPATLSTYLNRPEVTAEKLVDGWYRTGDIVRRDRNGFFYFIGRLDDMFICGGENVYPGEVEKLLERHTDILEAAVVSVNDAIKGAIPIAFVVARPDVRLDVEAVKAFTLREGPAFSHPRAIVELERLPVSGTHKVDRNALKQRAADAVSGLGRDSLT